jgi:YVTN family beta-propeller protein
MWVRLPTVSLLAALASTAGAQEPALLIVEKVASAVGFYTADGRRVGDFPVGKTPHEVVRSPDRRFAYVSDNGILWMTDPGQGGNTISVVDLRARRSAGVIDLGGYRRPHGMDVDPGTGRLVCTIENPDGLLLIDPAARRVLRKYDVQGKAPHMVVLGPGAEYAFVSNTGTDTVAAVHLASGRVKLIPTDAGPQGGVLSRDGTRIYLTNGKGNSISILDTARQERIGVIRTGQGPNRIALTPDGGTLVYSLGEGNGVGFADVARGREILQLGIGGRAMSLSLTADGRLAYVGVQDQDKVFVIAVPERKVARVIHTPQGAGPDPVLPLD